MQVNGGEKKNKFHHLKKSLFTSSTRVKRAGEGGSVDVNMFYKDGLEEKQQQGVAHSEQ